MILPVLCCFIGFVFQLCFAVSSGQAARLDQFDGLYRHVISSNFNATDGTIVHIGECVQNLCAKYYPISSIYCTEHVHSSNMMEFAYTEVIRCAEATILSKTTHEEYYFTEHRADVIVDTRHFSIESCQSTLLFLFPALRPGGFYLIEGVDFSQNGNHFQEHPDLLFSEINRILHDNHAYLADMSVHKRMNNGDETTHSEGWRRHSDYLLVLRKRNGAVPAIKINSGDVAMYGDGIVQASIESTNFILTHAEQVGVDYLEQLAFLYGPDKSRDDHKYTDFYSSLYSAQNRHSVTSLLEIGVAAGQSLQMWSDYFPQATIYGVDLGINNVVIDNLAALDRVYLFVADCQSGAGIATLPLSAASLDLIIDDGPHALVEQEITLRNFWHFLKPGGVYVIEDVGIPAAEGCHFVYHSERLTAFTQQILRENDAYLVDTLVGHRAFERYQNVTQTSTVSRTDHNSNLFVIHKRL